MTPPLSDAATARKPAPPRLFNSDFIIKLVSLAVSVAGVWYVYHTAVLPAAREAALEAQAIARNQPNFVAPRSLAVILKDPEQQSEVTIWIWAMVMLTLKMVRIGQENRMLGRSYLQLEPGERILPDDALEHHKDLRSAMERMPSWRERILPNVILAALHRFHATQSITDAAGAIKERVDVAGNEFEADLSLIRYIAWAISAIGFIGTVRGIGEALAQAQRAILGDIAGVVDALGLAFNSTLVALLLMLPLMFILHMLQGRQDKLAVDIQGYCDEHVVGQMKVPSQETPSAVFPA